MIPIDVEALILADAVGALDADERAALGTRLEELSYTTRLQAAALYDAAVVVAESVRQVDPPATVRARLMTAIGTDSGGLGPALRRPQT